MHKHNNEYMKHFFYFGERVPGYDVRVFNERELRAAAGILFVFAMSAFFNAWLAGNYLPLQVFVTLFMLDFIIRMLVNPKFAPSLILGRICVSNQTVEYSGAPQKRFAWGLGLALSITMFFLVVIFGITGPVNFLICIACLTFLFFETAFGICLGCSMYNFFTKEKAKLCPGGTCEIKQKQPIQKISSTQIGIVVLYILISVAIGMFYFSNNQFQQNQTSQKNVDCDIPTWVFDIGHEEQYVLHHDCQ